MKFQIDPKDKAAILAILYNNAMPTGVGIMQYKACNMSVAQAEQELQNSEDVVFERGVSVKNIDYLHGRFIKTLFGPDFITLERYAEHYKFEKSTLELLIAKAHDGETDFCLGNGKTSYYACFTPEASMEFFGLINFNVLRANDDVQVIGVIVPEETVEQDNTHGSER